jgi:hypothetical protein
MSRSIRPYRCKYPPRCSHHALRMSTQHHRTSNTAARSTQLRTRTPPVHCTGCGFQGTKLHHSGCRRTRRSSCLHTHKRQRCCNGCAGWRSPRSGRRWCTPPHRSSPCSHRRRCCCYNHRCQHTSKMHCRRCRTQARSIRQHSRMTVGCILFPCNRSRRGGQALHTAAHQPAGCMQVPVAPWRYTCRSAVRDV